MKYIYSWLKEHYPAIPAIADLEPLLIQLGHDVAAITPITYDEVRVAEIVTVGPHPNSDRLSIVTASVGNETVDVVCGAPNVRVGLKVPYAAVGTTLASGITLKKAVIRGIESNGMLCAPDELGLGESHEGLCELPDTAVLGEPITYYVAPDAILDIDITSNRGDVLSHFGLARDIAAGHSQTLLKPNWKEPTYSGSTSETVTLGAIHADASHLSVALASHAQEKAPTTPLYMAARLRLLGQKTINLASDITNYILLEFGQPLHAYDADSLGETIRIGVRRAHDGEQFEGLNKVTLTLTPQSLLIVNNDSPIGLAGILGGELSKSRGESQRVLFEAALFNRKAISLAARGLHLLTESALRFDRGIDTTLQAPALAHALALWQQITGGIVSTPLTHTEDTGAPQADITLTSDEVTTFLGTSVSLEQVTRLLASIGATITPEADSLEIASPTWRFDLALKEDYYEEIARLIGLHNLIKKPLSASVPQWKRSTYWKCESLKDTLVAMGAFEINSYPFTSKEEERLFGKLESLTLTLPPIDDKSQMRTTLIPGNLRAVAENPEIPQTLLFEVARAYFASEEKELICISASGSAESTLFDWWQNLFERWRLPVSSWMSRVQTLSPDMLATYKIRKSVVTMLEIAVDELPHIKSHEIPTVVMPDLDAIQYVPLSRFQASRRDIAFIAETTYGSDTVIQDLKNLDDKIINVELFDIYTNEAKLGSGKQSLAFQVYYQAPDRTLTNDDIDQLHKKVADYIQEHYHGTIR